MLKVLVPLSDWLVIACVLECSSKEEKPTLA